VISLKTFETFLIILWNLDSQNSADLRILKEPSKALATPLGSAEHRLKNLVLESGSLPSRSNCEKDIFPGRIRCYEAHSRVGKYRQILFS